MNHALQGVVDLIMPTVIVVRLHDVILLLAFLSGRRIVARGCGIEISDGISHWNRVGTVDAPSLLVGQALALYVVVVAGVVVVVVVGGRRESPGETEDTHEDSGATRGEVDSTRRHVRRAKARPEVRGLRKSDATDMTVVTRRPEKVAERARRCARERWRGGCSALVSPCAWEGLITI